MVFSDATLDEVASADPATFDAIRRQFYHWDDIHIHYRGERLESSGHGFAGLSRKDLLLLLHQRCEAMGVDLEFEVEISPDDAVLDADLVLGADGVNSRIRERYQDTFEARHRHASQPIRMAWHRPAVPSVHVLFQGGRPWTLASARLPV